MEITRRNLIKAKIATALGGVAASSKADTCPSPEPVNKRPLVSQRQLLAQEPMLKTVLSGVHAYGDTSVEAGQDFNLHVSADKSYKLNIYRLKGVEATEKGDDELVVGTYNVNNPSKQDISPGSFIHIEQNLQNTPMQQITLECWIRPREARRQWQGLITQYSNPTSCGIGLFLRPDKKIALYAGDGNRGFNPEHLFPSLGTVKDNEWNHIVATWNRGSGGKNRYRIFINNVKSEVSRSEGRNDINPGTSPLRLGAYGHQGKTGNTFSGDMAIPAIYSRILTVNEVRQRYNAPIPRVPEEFDVIASWRFDEEVGSEVKDGRGTRTGRIINGGTWQIGGPKWDANSVQKYSNYKIIDDPQRRHAIRFCQDDLYDCEWNPTFKIPIPADAKSGVHVARISSGQPNRDYHVTFVVKKPASRPKAPICVLASSNTWLAYNRVPFPGNPGTPRFSFYTPHAGGLIPYQMGTKVPNPSADPYGVYFETIDSQPDYSHLVKAERHTHRWLEDNGYDYDMISDADLDKDNDPLNGYKVLMILGHSEYWSTKAQARVESFLSSNGKVIALTGNTMLWRVSYDHVNGLVECRKEEKLNPNYTNYGYGESWHSLTDGCEMQGGLLRDSDHASAGILGLEPSGQVRSGLGRPNGAPKFDLTKMFGEFKVRDSGHELFNTPIRTGYVSGQNIGNVDGINVLTGHEWDSLPSTMRVRDAATQNQCPNALSLPTPGNGSGIQILAQGNRRANNYYLDYPFYCMNSLPVDNGTSVMGQMIYWDRPPHKRGSVFYCGSIAGGWPLSTDKDYSDLIKNVLHKFGVPM